MYGKPAEPQNPPFELLRIYALPGKSLHHPRIGTAREDDAGGFAAEHAVPKSAPLFARQISCGGTRSRGQPRAVEKSFQERGHADPPQGVDDDKMVAGLIESSPKTKRVGLELLPLAVSGR